MVVQPRYPGLLTRCYQARPKLDSRQGVTLGTGEYESRWLDAHLLGQMILKDGNQFFIH